MDSVALLVVLLVAIEVLLVITGVIEWVARELKKPATYEDRSRGTNTGR